MYRDWNKVGNIPQKTIDNMENNGYMYVVHISVVSFRKFLYA
uniref:Uncharacterized protein n=1 Tax=Meloidogyne enterolobii TaxID=390850 RepID=A0A6V7Y2L2_MELEN|nr:unnamed protein product [Meloidogyne enterolobii]